MRRYGYLAVIMLAYSLNACGSMPHQAKPDQTAYWSNPRWQAELLYSIQSVVHAPANIPSTSTPGIHGIVQILYANGKIENPKIIKSTGHPDLDKLMVKQIASAKLPKPIGSHAGRPHVFQIPLDMPTPFESYEYSTYAAISHRFYPRGSFMRGITGNVTIDFDDLDGKASHIVIAKSSGYSDLDKAAVKSIKRSTLPAAPPAYAGKTAHMKVIFCYSLKKSNVCQSGRNVIEIHGNLR